MLIKFLDLDDHIKRQENFRNNLCTSSDSEDEPLSGLDGGLYPAKTLTQSKSFHQRPFELAAIEKVLTVLF